MVARAALGLPTWKPPKLDITRRTTLIVDEAVMVDNDKLARALRHAEKAGCRVVLAGDPKQLASIGQGGLFREIYERARDEQKTTLTKIVRQGESWAREAIHQVGQGDAAQALKTFAENGRLHVAPTRDDAERRLIERWKEGGMTNPRDNLILASTNVEVDRLNQRAQEAVRETGRLGVRSVQVGQQRIHEGDRILFTDTNKRLGFVNSDFAIVTHVERLTRKLTVQIDGQENPVTFSLRKFDAVRLGYAATVHRAQGMTLEQNVYVLAGGSMQNREMTYVQISRAKCETHLFTDEAAAGRDLAELERLVKRSDEKFSAHGIAREEEERQKRQREQQQRREQGPELSR
jgi:ATP-dependent exoDNAse (exonuclease V) alpha subunit